MKVLVYGREGLITQISSNLARINIETTLVCDRENMPGCLDSRDKPDMVILDGMANNAEDAKDCIRRIWDVCTVLVIDLEKQSWQDLDKFMADGYITGRFHNNETLSRLLTIYRRYVMDTSNERPLIDELTAYYQCIQSDN